MHLLKILGTEKGGGDYSREPKHQLLDKHIESTISLITFIQSKVQFRQLAVTDRNTNIKVEVGLNLHHQKVYLVG